MENLLVCPTPAFLADVPSQTCPVKFDQIQRFLLTRLSATPFTETNILLEATWTPRMIASDNTKIVGTPKFAGFTLPILEPLKSGGNDNTTINGVASLDGLPFVPIPPFTIRNMNSIVAKALRALASESAPQPGETNLGVYFVNRFGNIIYRKSGANALPFPLYNFVVSDVGSDGLNRDNAHGITSDLEPGWSQDFAMLPVPLFNLLTIKNAT